MGARDSRLTDVYHHHQQHQQRQYDRGAGYYDAAAAAAGRAVVDAYGQLTPPDYFPIGDHAVMARNAAERRSAPVGSVGAWLEIWDYAGGNSFRAFLAGDREVKSLFVFFDANVLGRDLKQA